MIQKNGNPGPDEKTVSSLMLPASPRTGRTGTGWLAGHCCHSCLTFNSLYFMHCLSLWFSVLFYCFACSTSTVFSYFKFSIIDRNIHSKDLNQTYKLCICLQYLLVQGKGMGSMKPETVNYVKYDPLNTFSPPLLFYHCLFQL